jgi:hypothetical protein
MSLIAPPISAESGFAPGFVGRIPVRNLWLLMLYASDLFRTGGTAHVAVEESPDELPDLVAEILAHAVETRLHRQLSLGYRSREEWLGRHMGGAASPKQVRCIQHQQPQVPDWNAAWWPAALRSSPSTRHGIVSSALHWSPSPAWSRSQLSPIGADLSQRRCGPEASQASRRPAPR